MAPLIDDLDDAVLYWFVEHRSPGLTDFFETATSLGSWTVISIIGTGLALALLLARRPGSAAALTASVLGGIVISRALKGIFGLPRPPEAVRLTENVGHAF